MASSVPSPGASPPRGFAAAFQYGNQFGVNNDSRAGQIDQVCRNLLNYPPFLALIQNNHIDPSKGIDLSASYNQHNRALYFSISGGNKSARVILNSQHHDPKIIEAAAFLVDPQSPMPTFSSPAQPHSASPDPSAAAGAPLPSQQPPPPPALQNGPQQQIQPQAAPPPNPPQPQPNPIPVPPPPPLAPPLGNLRAGGNLEQFIDRKKEEIESLSFEGSPIEQLRQSLDHQLQTLEMAEKIYVKQTEKFIQERVGDQIPFLQKYESSYLSLYPYIYRLPANQIQPLQNKRNQIITLQKNKELLKNVFISDLQTTIKTIKDEIKKCKNEKNTNKFIQKKEEIKNLISQMLSTRLNRMNQIMGIRLGLTSAFIHAENLERASKQQQIVVVAGVIPPAPPINGFPPGTLIPANINQTLNQLNQELFEKDAQFKKDLMKQEEKLAEHFENLFDSYSQFAPREPDPIDSSAPSQSRIVSALAVGAALASPFLKGVGLRAIRYGALYQMGTPRSVIGLYGLLDVYNNGIGLSKPGDKMYIAAGLAAIGATGYFYGIGAAVPAIYQLATHMTMGSSMKNGLLAAFPHTLVPFAANWAKHMEIDQAADAAPYIPHAFSFAKEVYQGRPIADSIQSAISGFFYSRGFSEAASYIGKKFS